jgi:hypothetical protein
MKIGQHSPFRLETQNSRKIILPVPLTFLTIHQAPLARLFKLFFRLINNAAQSQFFDPTQTSARSKNVIDSLVPMTDVGRVYFRREHLAHAPAQVKNSSTACRCEP